MSDDFLKLFLTRLNSKYYFSFCWPVGTHPIIIRGYLIGIAKLLLQKSIKCTRELRPKQLSHKQSWYNIMTNLFYKLSGSCTKHTAVLQVNKCTKLQCNLTQLLNYNCSNLKLNKKKHKDDWTRYMLCPVTSKCNSHETSLISLAVELTR